MNADLWSDVCRILDHVLDLSFEECERYLDGLPDPALAAEVRRFVHVADVPHPLLESIGQAGPGLVEQVLLLPTPDAPSLPVGSLAGPFRLDAVAGRGGHGTVYRAYDTDADRTVAVKVLSSRREDVYVRLRSEVRVLARLDHPAIARFYSAGQTDDLRAYFAMEWVDGQPITAAADAHGLGFDARLALLATLAEAVQHAHERLVLHRDLKPDNVLVGDGPGGLHVKVVDFGIGKIEEPQEGPDALVAPYLRLTPAYAAPEQLRGEPASVASDLYSLAIIGRELLFSGAPAALEQTRDAEAVLTRALAPAAGDRYPNVGAFADDLRHVQRGRPVSARPLGRAERARRYARRHRRMLGQMAAAAAAVVLAAVFYVSSLVHARTLAEQEAAAASEAVTLLTGVFDTADPFSDQTDTLRARDIVDAAAAALQQNPPASEAVRVRLSCALAELYTSLEAIEAARPFFGPCLAREPRPATAWYTEALRSKVQHAMLANENGVARAEGRRAIRLSTQAFGAESRERALALATLARIHTYTPAGIDSGLALYAEAVPLARRTLGPASADLGPLLSEYAYALMLGNQRPRSIAVGNEAVQHTDRLFGRDHPKAAAARYRLAQVYADAGMPEVAEPLLRQALAVLRRTRDSQHPTALEIESMLATFRYRRGDVQGALQDFARLYEAKRERLGEGDVGVVFSCSSLGKLEVKTGRVAEGLARLDGCIASAVRAMGPDHGLVHFVGHVRGEALFGQQRYAECDRWMHDVAPRFSRADPKQSVVWEAHTLAGRCALAAGRAGQAQADAETALAGLHSIEGPADAATLDARLLLAHALAAQGQAARADSLLHARVRDLAAKVPRDSAAYAAAQADLRTARAQRPTPPAARPGR